MKLSIFSSSVLYLGGVALLVGLCLPRLAFAQPVLVQGQFIPVSQVNGDEEYAVGLQNMGQNLSLANLPSLSNSPWTWIAIEGNGTEFLDAAFDMGSDEPAEIIIPDDVLDQMGPTEFLSISEIFQSQQLNLQFDVDRPGVENVSLHEYLENSRFYIGLGALTGIPFDIQQAIAMTNGDVLFGDIPSLIAPNDAWALVDDGVELSPADFNGDGIVNGSDFLVWQNGFGITGNATPGDGDANGDGNVDGVDFLQWQLLFGTGVGGSGSVAVPEPSTIFLCGAVLLLTLTCNRISKGTISRL